jgi:hypothetical protein
VQGNPAWIAENRFEDDPVCVSACTFCFNVVLNLVHLLLWLLAYPPLARLVYLDSTATA